VLVLKVAENYSGLVFFNENLTLPRFNENVTLIRQTIVQGAKGIAPLPDGGESPVIADEK